MERMSGHIGPFVKLIADWHCLHEFASSPRNRSIVKNVGNSLIFSTIHAVIPSTTDTNSHQGETNE